MSDSISISTTAIGTPAQTPGFGSYCAAVISLSQRELTRFLRQRSRLIGALATPVMFWILFGAGLHGSFQAPDWAAGTMTYREYFLPGIAALIVMFTAIFSAMSIIEDRHEGFLQGVLVAPVPRSALVLGKVLGGTVLAVVQALIFVGLGWGLNAVGITSDLAFSFSALSIVELTFFMAAIAFGLTSLGFMLAWKLDSIQGFHAIMNVLLMPMWMLSGAFFPAADSGLLAWLMWLNPLTYGVAGIRRLLYTGQIETGSHGLPSLGHCVLVVVVFGLISFAAAVGQARQRVSRKRGTTTSRRTGH
jgi:ABC-2 type transport system permease protein